MTIFDEAIKLAVNAHSGTTRKGEQTPYILHVMEVACIASFISDDVDMLTAAVLHDAVEGTAVSVDEIAAKFGERVAQLVDAATEDKQDGRPPEESWRARKEYALRRLAETDDLAVKILWLADKTANLRSTYQALLKQGQEAWNSFHQKDPAQQHWFYRSVADLLQPDLGHTTTWKEFDALIKSTFEGSV